jgi:hypothetical protein
LKNATLFVWIQGCGGSAGLQSEFGGVPGGWGLNSVSFIGETLLIDSLDI